MQPNTLTPEQIAAINKTRKNRTIWGIILLAGPTALFIVTIVLFAVSNAIYAATLDTSGLFAQPNIAHIVINITSFIIGAIAVLAWLPGIITGIILLATKPAAPQQ